MSTRVLSPESTCFSHPLKRDERSAGLYISSLPGTFS